jgi:hypothetical protein
MPLWRPWLLLRLTAECSPEPIRLSRSATLSGKLSVAIGRFTPRPGEIWCANPDSSKVGDVQRLCASLPTSYEP